MYSEGNVKFKKSTYYECSTKKMYVETINFWPSYFQQLSLKILMSGRTEDLRREYTFITYWEPIKSS